MRKTKKISRRGASPDIRLATLVGKAWLCKIAHSGVIFLHGFVAMFLGVHFCVVVVVWRLHRLVASCRRFAVSSGHFAIASRRAAVTNSFFVSADAVPIESFFVSLNAMLAGSRAV